MSEPTQTWRFPPNNGGEIKGFNDAALDTFKGQRLSSMVREVIQNSLDAERVNEEAPIKVIFKIHKIPKNDATQITLIRTHLVSCMNAAKEQKLSDAVKFYKNGIERIDKDQEIKVLAIHDSNSKGLTGPTDKNFGPWSALVKGTGISQKSANSLGSFGHGSKAPFSLSDIRSIFYLSYVQTEKGVERRFQGKSILQTHVDPNDPTQHTQGTGFYGHVAKLMPLIDDEVPGWAKRFREMVTEGTGTSIFVPYTEYRKDLYPETRITVIANFFYAIRSGALEVTVGEDLIDKTNLVEWFHDCERILDDEQDEIDVDYIRDCFKSINTILFPDHSNVQQIPGFGRVEWYMRVNDELEKKVGLARSSGMLITRRPPDLWVFRNVKPFDMLFA